MAIPDPSLHGPSGSSDPSTNEVLFDFDTLPDPETVSGTVLPPDTKPEDLPICPVCDNPIIRDPSWKRMRKYHPECADQAKHAPAAGKTSTGRQSKAVKEAAIVAADYRSALAKLTVMVGLFDKYDAFVIGANMDTHVSAFENFLITHDRFRTECMNVKGGGSVFGLIASAAFIAAPILAHHGLVPGNLFAKSITELPFILFELSKRLKEGEDGLQDFVSGYMKDAREAKERAKAQQNGQHTDHKGGTYVPGTAYVGPS